MVEPCTCDELSRAAGVYCHVCMQILELELERIAENIRIAQIANPQRFADSVVPIYY